MAGNDWLGDRRTEVAADRILNAADALRNTLACR